MAQRDEIRATLGQQWWKASLLSAGRLFIDYLCLLAALRATGSLARGLILVVYAIAGIIGMIPITPGGLGIVEASLTGLLVLADVNSGAAAEHTDLPPRFLLGAAGRRAIAYACPPPVSPHSSPPNSSLSGEAHGGRNRQAALT